MTIPRLELMAVLIGVRCLKFVTDQLKLDLKQLYLWTDSQCVLHWIKSTKVLPVFIQNRVKEIRSNQNINFKHVSGSENPADIASRSSYLKEVSNCELWWHGPQWLLQAPNTWADHDHNTSTNCPQDEQEAHDTESMVLQVSDEDKNDTNLVPFGINIEKYSSLTKLLRVSALTLRFVKKIRQQSCENGYLKSSELKDVEQKWLLHVQKKYFASELDAISNAKRNNLQVQLGLYIDENGLLRCQGRLENAGLCENARHPILLHKKDTFTHLVIEKMHKEILHSGVSQTLAGVRQRFWIPHGRAAVKYVINKCTICRRFEGAPYEMPPMPPLPKSRVTEAKPFRRTGLDYLGPHFVKNKTPKKVWICLFTCLVTRAVHLEVVLDMTTEEFLLCFRRFVSQKGAPTQIISDNGSQFKAASSIVDQIWRKTISSEEVQTYVSNARITWIFIIELSPWMGGFYERLVGLVKRVFRKALGRRLLTLIQLQTLVKEAEAVINSRPLVYVGDDVNSSITLTPNHFLTLIPTIGIPESEKDDKDTDFRTKESTKDRLLEIWKKGQKVLNMFWTIWRNDYLLSLRERTQTRLKTGRSHFENHPQEGDIVLVKDDLPRGSWKCGKIVKLVQSSDNQIRSAKVKMPSGKLLGRPLCLLYPIETSTCVSDTVSPHVDTSSVKVSEPIKFVRVPRAAAEDAKRKIREQLSQ
ncbi:uncharacterized protein LOC123555228 [Mercenaria mercenaria]|uniref:uncharacterized protein LOC123555228 n=1 Tax=Mercenaria mercenaria TaxID=6596 RepID=UPI00234ECBA4|nr:uncharacterized protein LOC123555228 [Mercenaria mercenaria]